MAKKQHWHIWLRLHDKLAVAGNRLNHDHHIQLQDTKILSTKPGYMDWFIREATEMMLHPTKLKDGTLLSSSRKPLIHAFRKQRSLHSPSPLHQGMINVFTVLFRISSHSPCTPSLPKFPGGYSHVLGITTHVSSAVPHPTELQSHTKRGSFCCWTDDMEQTVLTLHSDQCSWPWYVLGPVRVITLCSCHFLS